LSVVSQSCCKNGAVYGDEADGDEETLAAFPKSEALIASPEFRLG